jgi:hypothetical protein
LINSLTPSSSNKIIFECFNLSNDIGLMITTTKNNNSNNNNCSNDNENNNDFQLHLYDGYNDIALVMSIDIKDLQICLILYLNIFREYR